MTHEVRILITPQRECGRGGCGHPYRLHAQSFDGSRRGCLEYLREYNESPRCGCTGFMVALTGDEAGESGA